MSVKTVNLLSEPNSLFNAEINDWIPVNASTVRSGTEIYQPTKDRNDDVSLAYFALGINAINHSTSFGSSINLQDIDTVYNGKYLQLHMMVYSQSTVTVDCNIVLDETISVDNDPPIWRLTDVVGGKWSVVRSPVIQIPNDENTHNVSFIINTFGGSDYPLFISIPGLISVNTLFDNQFVANTLEAMPNFYFDHDADDGVATNNKSPLFATRRFLDLGLSGANEALLLYLSYIRFAKEDGYDPSNPLMPLQFKSAIINPSAADSSTIQWLAQFAGRNIVDANDIFASRLNFPQTNAAIDAGVTLTENSATGISLTREAGVVSTNSASIFQSFYSGTGVVRVQSLSEADATFEGIFILQNNGDETKLYWDDDEYDAISTSTVTITEVSYTSIESYAANRLQFSQYQVDSRNFGLNAGTITALVETIKELLSGDKEVVLTYENRWIINVQTRINETPTYLLTSNQFNVLESVVTPIIPVGYAINFSLLPSSGGERMSLDQDPEGRMNLYALGNP
jgi:hypothetical protein